MKAYKGVEVHPHAFVTSHLDAYMWSDSPPGHLNPGNCIGPWAGPVVALVVFGKRNISSHGNNRPTISRSYNQQRSRYVAWTVADYTGWSKSPCTHDDYNTYVRCTETFWSLCIFPDGLRKFTIRMVCCQTKIWSRYMRNTIQDSQHLSGIFHIIYYLLIECMF
jgi:hypothetical protein